MKDGWRRRISQSVSRNAICSVLPLPHRAQLSEARERTLTKYSEIDVHFHGLHAHDVGDFASVTSLLVLRAGYEREHVLTEGVLLTSERRDPFAVPVPDNIGRRISAAWSAGELHILTTLHGFALGVAFDVRWPRWICEIKRSAWCVIILWKLRDNEISLQALTI